MVAIVVTAEQIDRFRACVRFLACPPTPSRRMTDSVQPAGQFLNGYRRRGERNPVKTELSSGLQVTGFRNRRARVAENALDGHTPLTNARAPL